MTEPIKRKWTRGEWTLSTVTGLISDPHGDIIAQVERMDARAPFRAQDSEAQANAHLLAASKKLFKALEVAVDIIDEEYRVGPNEYSGYNIPKRVEQIQAALSAALGK